MRSKPQICVIGLGKFGLQLGQSLVNLNHDVIGIDLDPQKIRSAQHIFTQVYEADVSRKKALEQIGFSDITHTIVSVGDSISTSAMTTMYLKELNVPNIWVKAINEDHVKLLYKIGADDVFIPEHIAANRLADRIDIPGFMQRLPFDSEMMIQEIVVKTLEGKTIREIDLTNRFDCQIMAVRKSDAHRYQYIPKADDVLERGDTVVIIGNRKSLSKIKP